MTEKVRGGNLFKFKDFYPIKARLFKSYRCVRERRMRSIRISTNRFYAFAAHTKHFKGAIYKVHQILRRPSVPDLVFVWFCPSFSTALLCIISNTTANLRIERPRLVRQVSVVTKSTFYITVMSLPSCLDCWNDTERHVGQVWGRKAHVGFLDCSLRSRAIHTFVYGMTVLRKMRRFFYYFLPLLHNSTSECGSHSPHCKASAHFVNHMRDQIFRALWFFYVYWFPAKVCFPHLCTLKENFITLYSDHYEC